jgi:ABC-type lipoprotein export system ATPase subunit
VETILRERMAGGAAIIMVTHSPAQAKRMASRRFEMKAGHLELVA